MKRTVDLFLMFSAWGTVAVGQLDTTFLVLMTALFVGVAQQDYEISANPFTKIH